ncbi:glycoside hydrolase family 6 protein [Streptomyces sp. DH37]|uniref:glycoside hydrolase family 6 protein n=1 Tax=Streptomyces sp. DH37 TaxID=3040122 RepID=UPI002441CB6E|nr:glycoside hydrolase family 6 protein [Streptomyces sp. DH37]MDG9705514.1 glycoside hydrolase family 6 protein [Streptomyces sp. DH37]
MHRRRRGITAGAGAAAALALIAGTTGTAGAADRSGGVGEDRGPGRARLYVPPANPDAYTQIRGLVEEGRYRDAAGIARMVTTPQAVWLNGNGDDSRIRREVARIVRDAARRHALPVLALYNVPGRDCSQYSAGGAANTAEYTAWIDEVAAGIGGKRALVVLEPDSLALLPSDCGQDDDEGTLTAARYAEIEYAVDTLAARPGTSVYLDAGHSGWHSVNSIVPRLAEAGVDRTRGFFLNASNYRADGELAWYGKLVSGCLEYARGGGDPASCPNQWWDRNDAQAWLDENVTADPADQPHFVTDTSRNGKGPWTPPTDQYPDPQDWCNPPDRGLGERPTTRTGDPLNDARLWIKVPGESDGLCLRGTEGPEDPARGTVAPPAGQWFPEQALELVRNAEPPLRP